VFIKKTPVSFSSINENKVDVFGCAIEEIEVRRNKEIVITIQLLLSSERKKFLMLITRIAAVFIVFKPTLYLFNSLISFV